MATPSTPSVDIESLISLFHDTPLALGPWQAVSADTLPKEHARLLAHDHHMTVTLESHFGSLVDVEVIQSIRVGETYSREILLRTRSNGRVVLYGIVRLNLDALPQTVVEAILSEQVPLGRVLISNHVLREVRLQNLLRFYPSKYLQQYLTQDGNLPCYGRSAMIFCDGQPAIELLEIVG